MGAASSVIKEGLALASNGGRIRILEIVEEIFDAHLGRVWQPPRVELSTGTGVACGVDITREGRQGVVGRVGPRVLDRAAPFVLLRCIG